MRHDPWTGEKIYTKYEDDCAKVTAVLFIAYLVIVVLAGIKAIDFAYAWAALGSLITWSLWSGVTQWLYEHE